MSTLKIEIETSQIAKTLSAASVVVGACLGVSGAATALTAGIEGVIWEKDFISRLENADLSGTNGVTGLDVRSTQNVKDLHIASAFAITGGAISAIVSCFTFYAKFMRSKKLPLGGIIVAQIIACACCVVALALTPAVIIFNIRGL
jgi:hypothetical protein